MRRLKNKEIAEAKGISQGKLSRWADVSPNTLRAIYKDPYKEVSTATLERLARALEVPVIELIEEVSRDREK